MLHITPVIDHIGLGAIAQETANDKTLQRVTKLLRSGKTSVPKTESEGVQRFDQILAELTIAGNGVIFKGDRMVLPTSLQEAAIELAHRGAHPGRTGIERRLRSHFFFHDMFIKVKNYVLGCRECSIFEDKKTKEPLDHHKVPLKCWE